MGDFYKPHIRIPIIPTRIQWKVGVFFFVAQMGHPSLLGDGLGRGFEPVILLMVRSEIRQTHQLRLVVYRLSHCLQELIHFKWLAGFLNHQQYVCEIGSSPHGVGWTLNNETNKHQ